MATGAGMRVGPYSIVAVLGAGGMGEVYRARDTRLGRDVALKLLPQAFAADPDRLQRFEREARTLASLNHPNIAQIYDGGSEATAGMAFLAMELVEGRTLEELIASDAPLSPEAAVRIAAQITDALEAAHEQGIVHRDLKPANVKVRDDGVVKVLDFGLARLAEPATAATFSSPTVLSPAVTQQGVILGTAGYMSPEQARGRTPDKRADIWAFGVVVYEMLTAQRMFAGDTVQELLAAVIKDAPPLDRLPASTPPALRRLIARCLERDPKVRLRDIGEARITLSTVLDPNDPVNRAAAGSTASATVGPQSSRAGWGWGLAAAGAIALAAIVAASGWRSPDTASVPVRRFILPPAIAESSSFAIAPDGRRIAYLRAGRLWLHALETATTADLGAVPPTAETVFWSPDSRTIGYSAEGALRTMPAAGGPTFTVCRLPASGRLTAAAWDADQTILVAVWRDSLYRVAAKGGTPALAAAIDPETEIDFHSVAPLPGGRVIVTTHLSRDNDIRADMVAQGRRTPITGELDVRSVAVQGADRLLFAREQTNRGVWAAPLAGETLDLAQAALVEPGAVSFSVSAEGTIVSLVPPRERREAVWVDRSGRVSGVPGPAFESRVPYVALSPDGRRAVIGVRSRQGGDALVVRDLASGADTTVPWPHGITNAASTGLVSWTPAGRLLIGSDGNGPIFDWPADGSADGRELASGFSALLVKNGTELLFNRPERLQYRLFRAPMRPDGSTGAVQPVFQEKDPPNVRWFDVTADGQLLAYAQTDTGENAQINVFVATYPGASERRQVTTAGGSRPRWSPDGHELFFLSGVRTLPGYTAGQILVAPVTRAPLAVGAPKVLFTFDDSLMSADRPLAIDGFDVASDGRLLMTRTLPAADGDEARLVLLQNWRSAIGR